MKKIIFFLLLPYFCFSQNIKFEYLPKNKDSLINYINQITDKKIKIFGDKFKKEIKETLIDRKNNFIEKVNDSSFIFNPEINSYLNSILKEIYKSNAEINSKDFYFFIQKSPIPNAACYGNGIFTINLGLFNYVNSDDELAFIICHEIAHYNLDHNDKSLLTYLETINSKDVKKKISKVKNQEFGKRKAFSDLMSDLNYNFLKRSQKVEIQADSLGLFYFKSTKYNIDASTSSLKNLELSDNIIFNEDSKIKIHFNFENYPFKEAWILKDETLFDLKKVSDDYTNDKDSLSTHPDIPLRIEKINSLITKHNNQQTVNPITLNSIKKIASLISVENFIDSKKIDLALYQNLILYNKSLIEKKQFINTICELLKKTYELKVKHTFGKYVSPIYPFSDELYLNEVKLFLNNIEIKNVRIIGLNFCIDNQEIMKGNEQFNNIFEYFKKLNP